VAEKGIRWKERQCRVVRGLAIFGRKEYNVLTQL
jgi:hypothetical protein